VRYFFVFPLVGSRFLLALGICDFGGVASIFFIAASRSVSLALQSHLKPVDSSKLTPEELEGKGTL
jgi:hypothetical protein